jgi:hypothetical protein
MAGRDLGICREELKINHEEYGLLKISLRVFNGIVL